MRHVQFQHVETGSNGVHGGIHEIGFHPVHLFPRHFPGQVAVLQVRQGRRRNNLPGIFRKGLVDAALPGDAGRALAPGVTYLRTDFCFAVAVHERTDAPPLFRLFRIPYPGAAGRDAPVRRGAQHFRIHETDAAYGPGAVMNKMPVPGHAVQRAVLAHGGQLYAVLHAQPGYPERLEHRCCRVFRVDIVEPGQGAGMLRKPAVHGTDKSRIAQPQVVVSHAFGTHQHVERELQRILPGVTVHVLEPAQAGDRGALQAVRLGFAHLLVGVQGRTDPVAALLKYMRQRDRVFHGQLGAGTDGKMRRAARIAQQHDIPVTEPCVAHHGKLAPERAVGDDGMALQVFPEHLLDIGPGILLRERIHPRIQPGLVAALHDPGGHALFITVPVHPPPAMFVAAERKGEIVQRQGGSQPAEAIGTPVHFGAEFFGIRAAHHGGDAVAGDNQVVAVHVQLRQVGDVGIESQGNAKLLATVMQGIQQLKARQAAEAVAAADDPGPMDARLYPVPVGELLDYAFVAGRIGLHEPAQGIIGKYHPETPGSVARTALDHGNIMTGIRFFHQQGEIERRRPPSETDYFQTVHARYSIYLWKPWFNQGFSKCKWNYLTCKRSVFPVPSEFPCLLLFFFQAFPYGLQQAYEFLLFHGLEHTQDFVGPALMVRRHLAEQFGARP